MYENKNFLAIIPARGGSKGIPRKNIRLLAGRPLIAWTLEAAQKSRYIDRIILSSEDPEIIAAGRSLGCEVPFIRPSELAQDDTPGIEPVLHAIRALPEKYDFIVLLQPTSPLRSAEDIDGCIEQCFRHKALSCVSVTEVEQNPYWMYQLDSGMKMIPLIPEPGTILRRQDLPEVYALNGALYIAATRFVTDHRSFFSPDTVAYIMPKQRSIDIDEEKDFEYCEWILKSQGNSVNE